MEAASGFEPESRGFAEVDRGSEQVDRLRPTRPDPHSNSTLRPSYPTTTRASSNPSCLVWGKDGASKNRPGRPYPRALPGLGSEGGEAGTDLR